MVDLCLGWLAIFTDLTPLESGEIFYNKSSRLFMLGIAVVHAFADVPLSGYCDSTAIRLRFGFDSTTTRNEHVHFFVVSRGVGANKKAVDGAYSLMTQ